MAQLSIVLNMGPVFFGALMAAEAEPRAQVHRTDSYYSKRIGSSERPRSVACTFTVGRKKKRANPACGNDVMRRRRDAEICPLPPPPSPWKANQPIRRMRHWYCSRNTVLTATSAPPPPPPYMWAASGVES